MLWCVITTTVLEVLFTPLLLQPGLKQIYLQNIHKSHWGNEFSNYSISLLKFHLECIIKLVCEKRKRDNVVKKRELL